MKAVVSTQFDYVSTRAGFVPVAGFLFALWLLGRDAMLVLSRKIGQSIDVGGKIRFTVVEHRGNTIRIGIDAPRELNIVRTELVEEMEAESDKTSPGVGPLGGRIASLRDRGV